MKFPSLIIKGFLAITEAELNLADRGLVAIQGKNLSDTSAESNGAGKSSIADALCWCWFGTTARGASGDEVVNDKIGKDCMVKSVIIDDDGTTYTATRYRKHRTGKNRLEIEKSDGLTTTSLTKGTDKLTQIAANQIIGSSLEVFSGSIYAGQENMPDLPAMPDKALKMLIEEAAGVTVLEAAYKASRDELVLKTADLTLAKSSLSTMETRKTALQDSITAANADHTAWADEQRLKIRSEVDLAKKAAIAAGDLRTEVDALDAQSVKDKIAAIDTAIAGLATENSTKKGLENVLSANATASAQFAAHVGFNQTSLKSDEKKKENLLNTIGTPCTECGRPISKDELIAKEAALDKRISDAKIAISESDREITRLGLEYARERQKLTNFVSGMTDIATSQSERVDLSRQLEEINSKVAQLKGAIGDIQARKDRATELVKMANPFDESIKRYNAELSDLDDDIKLAASRVESATIDVETDKEVVRVFSPSGVRSRILDEVTPFLNTQTAKYLSTLSDGNIAATWTTLVPASKKGEFKEKFSIEVTNDKGGKSFKVVSGGEKRKVRISTALALQDLVATRATKPIDLFIGDEIDDALDKAGLERLMTILEEKARERGSVFIISHNELSDYIKDIVQVEKASDGTTKITEIMI